MFPRRPLLFLVLLVAPAVGFASLPQQKHRAAHLATTRGSSFGLQMANERRSFLETTATLVAGLLLTTTDVAKAIEVGGKMELGDESIMIPKAHGTSSMPVQSDLLYGVSNKLADKICNYNRHFAEMSGYFQSTNFQDVVRNASAKGEPVTFYDSVTGKPLFVAPIGRSAEEFLTESKVHGWPSFRDQEVVWDNVRVLKDSGETVSVDGTHLGHNIPDSRNRYCINLVSIAGQPTKASS